MIDWIPTQSKAEVFEATAAQREIGLREYFPALADAIASGPLHPAECQSQSEPSPDWRFDPGCLSSRGAQPTVHQTVVQRNVYAVLKR